ncbi:MarR family winged helix-turn-helix transcriptional regulator [Sanguibacter suaedae]|uniref:MarR family transcriptional regulator n=1 Tax=Sanguibacter suaedae TaxID=2795737 RepID=A0A934I673_9MICO|nr:MarR family transcriptional regulator [Sanguibacter suaedae]MBI9113942.1 MarR family transcriptional regulator [Sanguibacter suaedae]
MTAQTTEALWLSDQEQASWRAFLEGTARLSEALNKDLEIDSELSLNEYEVLVRLSESPTDSLRMSQLADSLAHSRSRITHTVRRMEERGLVVRESCAVDGRGVNCTLTDTGRAHLVEAAPSHVRSVRRHLVDVLTPQQLKNLGEAMQRVADACR